jgi:hypothetical protein
MPICCQQTIYSRQNFLFMFCLKNIAIKYYKRLEDICCLYRVFILANKKTSQILSYFNAKFYKNSWKIFKLFLWRRSTEMLLYTIRKLAVNYIFHSFGKCATSFCIPKENFWNICETRKLHNNVKYNSDDTAWPKLTLHETVRLENLLVYFLPLLSFLRGEYSRTIRRSSALQECFVSCRRILPVSR